MGRHAAGEGFLRAYVRHGAAERFACYAASRREADSFEEFCRANGAGKRPVQWLPFGQLIELQAAGTLFFPGPGLAEMAWVRSRLGNNAYSLTGVTHTISSHAVMDAVTATLTAPVEPWDALVCTSRAVMDAVTELVNVQAGYLKQRLDAKRIPKLNIARIPLGADCERLAPTPEPRRRWREQLGIGSDDVVYLFVGRLSYHAKANPYPMYVALEHAAHASGKRLHLIQAGWFANDSIERRFREAAAVLCPNVNAIFLDGRAPEVREGIWHAADVFTSLSDNIQETFGMTPVEAMAAGLPCVVSDWDGYRDTVRDGIDGFLIPTLAPPPGLGADLAARHEEHLDNYDVYIGQASLFTSVDIQATAEAYTRLALNRDLRSSMGAAGRARAIATFDWKVIVRQYEALWEELAKRRAKAAPAKPVAILHPSRPDPFRLFAGYPTRTLEGSDQLFLTDVHAITKLRDLRKIHLVSYGAGLLPDEAQTEGILAEIAKRPGLPVANALEVLPPESRPQMMRGLVWLVKLGLVRVTPDNPVMPMKPEC